MKKKWVFLSIFLGFVQVLQATLFLPIDSTRLSRVELSRNFQNRIALDCGRISQIIHPGCDIDINLDEEIGQVFVYPLISLPSPVSLTVVTDKGLVQDLELNFVDKSSEIVILKTPEEIQEEFVEERSVIRPCKPNYYKQVVESVLNNQVPEGFIASEAPKKCRKVKRGVRAVLVSRFISPEETLYIWQIENHSKNNQKIQEVDLCFQKARWKYLEAHQISRKGCTTAILGVNNS